MDEVKSSDRVLHYLARERMQHWVESIQTDTPGAPGREIAVYTHRMGNPTAPHLRDTIDGITVTIGSHAGTHYALRCEGTLPTAGREAVGFDRRYDDFEVAKVDALEWIEQAEFTLTEAQAATRTYRAAVGRTISHHRIVEQDLRTHEVDSRSA